ncbi:MAG TPA: rhomboid family intramembrane serine protease [Chthoniobacteraceae bacterium]|nr:rhomboid family intramembrane serine protease [Chthoniobacteraceae bacterium]
MRPSRRQTQPFVRRWAAGRPSATALLVALSVGGYVAQVLLEYVLAEHDQIALLWRWLALDGAGIAAGEYWKFLSFTLLHFHPLQIIANMLLLYFAGREVEPIVGARNFLIIYGVGTLLGGGVSWLALPAFPVVGTCAAVTAVIVAFATILPELEVTVNVFYVLPLRLRAKWLALALLAMSGVMWATRTPPQIGAPGMVAAGIFSWFFVKQLGFGNPLAIQRFIFNRRQRAARLDRMSPEQFITAEIDPILEKISRDGLHSLTRAERKILAQGREKIASRTGAK